MIDAKTKSNLKTSKVTISKRGRSQSLSIISPKSLTPSVNIKMTIAKMILIKFGIDKLHFV